RTPARSPAAPRWPPRGRGSRPRRRRSAPRAPARGAPAPSRPRWRRAGNRRRRLRRGGGGGSAPPVVGGSRASPVSRVGAPAPPPTAAQRSTSMARGATRAVYRLVLRGELDDRFSFFFNGLEMERRAGTTVLTGEVVDQSQLHGFIERVEELGLELV